MCGYGDDEPSSRQPPGPKRGDHPSEEQQNMAEKLRIVQDILAKSHPDLQFDDMESLRKYASSNPHTPQQLNREGVRPKPLLVDIGPSYNEDDDDPVEPKQGEFLGTTPIPTASVTVFNQGKTRKSRASN